MKPVVSCGKEEVKNAETGEVERDGVTSKDYSMQY